MTEQRCWQKGVPDGFSCHGLFGMSGHQWIVSGGLLKTS